MKFKNIKYKEVPKWKICVRYNGLVEQLGYTNVESHFCLGKINKEFGHIFWSTIKTKG